MHYSTNKNYRVPCIKRLHTSRNSLKHAEEGPSMRSTNSAVSLKGADSTDDRVKRGAGGRACEPTVGSASAGTRRKSTDENENMR